MVFKNIMQKIEEERRLSEMVSLPFIVNENYVCFYYNVNGLQPKGEVQVNVNRAIIINDINSYIVDLSVNCVIKISMEEFEDEDDYFEYFANLVNSNLCNVSCETQFETMEKYMPQGFIQVYVEVLNKIIER